MQLPPDHAGKVTLFDRVTGQRLERWPVDARDLLATGGYTTDPNITASADSVPVASVVEPLPALPAVPEPIAAPAEAPAPKRPRSRSR